MRANTGMVSKQRGMDVGNGMAGNKQVSCEVVGDACLKLLSCDRELQTRARRPRLAPGSIRVAKVLGLEASSTSLAVRRHHNHNRSIDVTWQYRKNQSLRYSVSRAPLLYINSDFGTSLVDYRHSLQATCCLRQTKPAVLAPLH